MKSCLTPDKGPVSHYRSWRSRLVCRLVARHSGRQSSYCVTTSIRNGWPLSGRRRDGLVGLLRVPLVLAFRVLADANARRFARRRVDQHDVGDVKRSLDLDDTRLAGASGLDVLLDDVDALDHHTIDLGHELADGTALALVTTGD